MCLLNHLPPCESFRSPPVHVDCWLLLVFFHSRSLQLLLNWDQSQRSSFSNLWIPGKYFSLLIFRFVSIEITSYFLPRHASQNYEFQGSISHLTVSYLLQTYCCSQGVPKRQDPNNYSDTETKALSSISHSPVLYLYICYNHIAATLHRAYSLLKLHNGIAFNGFFIKVINIKTSGLSSVLSI